MAWTKNKRPIGKSNPTGNGKQMKHMLDETGKKLIDDSIWDIYKDIQEQLPYCELDYIINMYINGGENPSDTEKLLYTDTTPAGKSAAETNELLKKAEQGINAMKNIYKTKHGNINIVNSNNGSKEKKTTTVDTNAETQINKKGEKKDEKN